MNGIDFLDLITLLSFALQIENQKNIVGIADVQEEVNRAVAEIHGHLEEQDRKIDVLLGRKT
ncbi:MAG: hypothetical protein IJI19_06000 [Ruminococcus sp.]|nr:hypothetical protein [Ruminococcus sp.]